MLPISRILLANIKPLSLYKNVSSMTALPSPTPIYTSTVSDTLIRIYNKYHQKNDISFAKAACQAAKYLDEYFSHSDQRYRNDNLIFLYQIYHTFAEMIFYTLEIVEYDHYTNNTRDLENIHYNIYRNTDFNEHCSSDEGLHGETSLFMISHIAQKTKFDTDFTLREFQRHTQHVDVYIGKLMLYLQAKHLSNIK
ncbi:unnamed protein product [Adineta ricciae]|uniref:Uncharacterized protein n=1 Tax=Adineta ricciae TaxID=249248 RepID=A0A814KV53_ADIRI|nr:unnamed protein product [Adineta ricciae]CAF1094451.1 unnamed protein product [Adineta ricciae]